MNLQFIQDTKGNTTGVFIPIEEWQILKSKYADLQIDEIENNSELSSWQKEIIDVRLNDYYKNPNDVDDFSKLLDDIEKGI